MFRFKEVEKRFDAEEEIKNPKKLGYTKIKPEYELSIDELNNMVFNEFMKVREA